MAKDPFQGKERTCPQCGKIFFLPPENVYKIRVGKGKLEHLCSYSCWMQAKRELGQ